MIRAYVTALYQQMEKDPRVCSLLSDSGTEYDRLMVRDFPGRCFNFGITEQNQVAAAAGMAAMGKIPFVYTTGAFLAYRAYEFIRDDVCFQRRNVKLVGMGMGAWSTLGPSHHSTEDIAALRALPGLTLLCASTPRQLAGMVKAACELDGPVYLRMGAGGERELYPAEYRYEPGKIGVLRTGADGAVFATGSILGEAWDAVERLRSEGVSLTLADVHTLKPLDGAGVLTAAGGKRRVFTVEDHSVFGGLGGAVAEVLAGAGSSAALRRIGLNDRFALGCGGAQEVRRANGLDAEGIYRQIKEALEA